MATVEKKIRTPEEVFEGLRNIVPEEVEKWNRLENLLRKNQLLVSLRGHDGIKLLLDRFRAEIATIDRVLLTDKSLFESPQGHLKGLLLHERKRWCTSFINLFINAKKGVDNIIKDTNKELNETTHE